MVQNHGFCLEFDEIRKCADYNKNFKNARSVTNISQMKLRSPNKITIYMRSIFSNSRGVISDGALKTNEILMQI